jgi:hypothetical protein
MRRSGSLVAVAVTLAVSGCNGEDGNGTGSKEDGSRESSPGAEQTPLGRRDAPPAGVAEQVSYFEVGNGGCPEGDRPTVRFLGGFPREGQESIGQSFVICVSGFAKDRPVTVDVLRPDGREVERRVAFNPGYGLHPLTWTPLPGDPLGRYDVTATQGDTTAKASFSMSLAPIRRVRLMDDYVPPGRPVRIVLAGFEPGEVVRLDLYRSREPPTGRFSYLSSISARTDRRGEAVHQFTTAPDDPRDKYLVRFNRLAQDTFRLDDPPPDPR